MACFWLVKIWLAKESLDKSTWLVSCLSKCWKLARLQITDQQNIYSVAFYSDQALTVLYWCLWQNNIFVRIILSWHTLTKNNNLQSSIWKERNLCLTVPEKFSTHTCTLWFRNDMAANCVKCKHAGLGTLVSVVTILQDNQN